MAEKTSGYLLRSAYACGQIIGGEHARKLGHQRERYFFVEEKRAGDSEFYTFDFNFDTNANNQNLYEVVKPIVNTAVNGINSTVIAYGQNSSGKTHTIMGHDRDLGIIPRAIDDIFSYTANTPERKFLIRA